MLFHLMLLMMPQDVLAGKAASAVLVLASIYHKLVHGTATGNRVVPCMKIATHISAVLDGLALGSAAEVAMSEMAAALYPDFADLGDAKAFLAKIAESGDPGGPNEIALAMSWLMPDGKPDAGRAEKALAAAAMHRLSRQ